MKSDALNNSLLDAIRRRIRRVGGGLPRLLTWVISMGASNGAMADEAIPFRPIADIFKPLSTPASAIHDVSVFVLIICLGIFLVVGGLLIYTIWKFREKPGDHDDHEPPQVYGSTQIELAWTVLPILITVVLILVTARTIGEIQNKEMPENAINLRVVGHQWWWEVHYTNPEYQFVTANEIHIPVSRNDQRIITHLTLESADVVHSFWVPQLNGKTDVVPNRKNHMWLEPTATGTYLGNCAEYCGTQHANMLLRVIVHEPAEFEEWVKQQKAPPVNDPRVAKGRQRFMETNCINCHQIGGTVAVGVFGPDLTHLMSRETIGAGVVPNTPENLRAWVRDPQLIKVGCLMPDLQLPDSDVDEIVAYLLTLK